MLYKLHSLLPSKDKIVLVSNFTKVCLCVCMLIHCSVVHSQKHIGNNLWLTLIFTAFTIGGHFKSQ